MLVRFDRPADGVRAEVLKLFWRELGTRVRLVDTEFRSFCLEGLDPAECEALRDLYGCQTSNSFAIAR